LLPCVETPAGAASAPMIVAGERALPQELTVLVVEDEIPLRQAVVKKLRKTGFEVIEAPDGSAAIDLLKVNIEKIDVMLLDMTIPGAPNTQVVAEAARTRPDIKVILTSAYGQEMVMAPFSASNICGFIWKPFQLEDLVITLRRASSAS